MNVPTEEEQVMMCLASASSADLLSTPLENVKCQWTQVGVRRVGQTVVFKNELKVECSKSDSSQIVLNYIAHCILP